MNKLALALVAWLAIVAAASAQIVGGGSVSTPSVGGRLTLQSGVPVQVADSLAVGTIFYDCYVGRSVPVGPVAAVNQLPITGCEISLILDSTNHVSGSVYDIFFVVSGGAGKLCAGPAWTNTTTRAVLVHNTLGFWTNQQTVTSCFNNSVNLGSFVADTATLIGSFEATGNGQTGWNTGYPFANGGTTGVVAVANIYNMVEFTTGEIDSKTSWTYATGTWRASDGANNNIYILDSIGNKNVLAAFGELTTPSGTDCSIGTDKNSASATPNSSSFMVGTESTTVVDHFPASVGYNYFQAMEYANGGSCTFYGYSYYALNVTYMN
jgi:hypothetical protein